MGLYIIIFLLFLYLPISAADDQIDSVVLSKDAIVFIKEKAIEQQEQTQVLSKKLAFIKDAEEKLERFDQQMQSIPLTKRKSIEDDLERAKKELSGHREMIEDRVSKDELEKRTVKRLCSRNLMRDARAAAQKIMDPEMRALELKKIEEKELQNATFLRNKAALSTPRVRESLLQQQKGNKTDSGLKNDTTDIDTRKDVNDEKRDDVNRRNNYSAFSAGSLGLAALFYLFYRSVNRTPIDSIKDLASSIEEGNAHHQSKALTLLTELEKQLQKDMQSMSHQQRQSVIALFEYIDFIRQGPISKDMLEVVIVSVAGICSR